MESLSNMFDYIIILIGVIIACRSLKYGLYLLMISCCTFFGVYNFFSVNMPSGGGSISMPDLIIIVIFFRTVIGFKTEEKSISTKLCTSMLGWLIISVLLAFVFEQSIGLREIYRQCIRIALYWIIPLTICRFKEEEIKNIIIFMFGLSIVTSFIHVFSLCDKNAPLLAWLNPFDCEKIYKISTEAHYQSMFDIGVFPRIYPSSHIFIHMTLGFFMGFLFMNFQMIKKWYLGIALVLMLLYILFLGGRSNLMGIAVSFLFNLFTLALLSGFRNIKSSLLKLLLIGSIIGGVSIFALSYFFDSSVVTSIIERFQEKSLEVDGERSKDTSEAFSVLLNSPLYGIGQPKVHWEPTMGDYGGQDVAPLISLGLIGGFPMILMFGIFCLWLTDRYFKAINKSTTANIEVVKLAAAAAIISGLFFAFIGTTPSFLYSSNQIPLGIFCGFLMRKWNA